MNKQEILENLQGFKLGEIESEIYLYLLENGPRSALNLSREMNIDRSKVYRYAKKLSDKKLLESTATARGGKLKAANPKHLELLIQENESVLENQKTIYPKLLENLSKLSNYQDNEFEIKHYRGKEGLKQMMWNQLTAKKELLYFGLESRNELVGKAFAEKVREEQMRRKITLYEIENIDDRNNLWYTDSANWNNYYKSLPISKEILEIKQLTGVFNNTVSIMNSSKSEPIGVEIINSFYANMQRQVFWQFWKLAEESTT